MNFRYQSGNRGTNAVIGLVVLVGFILAFVYLAKSIFWLLTVLSPILLVLTLIINYKVVTNFVKYVANQYKKNLLSGLLTTGLTIFFYPIVFGYLFVKALITRKVDKLIQEQEIREKGELVDYEIVEEDFLELPDIQKAQKEPENGYDDLFKE